MALNLLSLKPIKRSKGQDAVASAAYRSAEKLHNTRNDITHDFTRKRDIVHTAIMIPEHAPDEFFDRETLWNTVEHAEKRKDSRVAKEIVLALPRELSLETSISMVKEFVSKCFIPLGMCADIAVHIGRSKDRQHTESVHDKNHLHNPHCHIMLTDRPVDKDGFCPKKNPDWNSVQHLKGWRREWATIQNKTFERKGLAVRVSHESYKKRNIDRESTKHLGPVAMAMERRGIKTAHGNENRAIMKRNSERDKQQHERKLNRVCGKSR